MSSEDLTLYAESSWVSPWAFHAMVALEEKRLAYKLELVPLPIPAETKAKLREKSLLGKVPILVHGDLWISESLAISEYLAERFPTPNHPRLFPADLSERARARQVMSFLRTGLFGLREDRPTSTVFGRPDAKPMSDKAKADTAELLHVATTLIKPGQRSLFGDWCIADADLALMLMRLVANDDPVPAHVVDYTRAVWSRDSVKTFLSHIGP
jgi:glutathione S-transferase